MRLVASLYMIRFSYAIPQLLFVPLCIGYKDTCLYIGPTLRINTLDEKLTKYRNVFCF